MPCHIPAEAVNVRRAFKSLNSDIIFTGFPRLDMLIYYHNTAAWYEIPRALVDDYVSNMYTQVHGVFYIVRSPFSFIDYGRKQSLDLLFLVGGTVSLRLTCR